MVQLKADEASVAIMMMKGTGSIQRINRKWHLKRLYAR